MNLFERLRVRFFEKDIKYVEGKFKKHIPPSASLWDLFSSMRLEYLTLRERYKYDSMAVQIAEDWATYIRGLGKLHFSKTSNERREAHIILDAIKERFEVLLG